MVFTSKKNAAIPCQLKTLFLHQYSLGHFSELEGAGRRPKPQWGENGHDRKLQRYKTQRLVTHLHRDTAHDPECHTSSERLSHPAVSEQPCSQKSVVSHVPLRVRVQTANQPQIHQAPRDYDRDADKEVAGMTGLYY